MKDVSSNKRNRYAAIIERIFTGAYKPGAREIPFTGEDLVRIAAELDIKLPENKYDLIYSFRFRASFPPTITRTARPGETWVIRLRGRAGYALTLIKEFRAEPNPHLAETKIPDATPGIVSCYMLGDEQALLARIRYNRLVDIFTGVTCYSLQNHLRTTVGGFGQIETDEIYVGLDRRGTHFVFPLQAKSREDRFGVVQVEQDFALCAKKFPGLVCRPISARFMEPNLIALFEFEETTGEIRIAAERHYRLVPADAISADELAAYRSRSEN